MTSKELVIRTLEFRNTDGRVPRQLWTLPWATERFGDRIHQSGLNGLHGLMCLHFRQYDIGNPADHQLRQMTVIQRIPVNCHTHATFNGFLLRIAENQHMTGQISAGAQIHNDLYITVDTDSLLRRIKTAHGKLANS